MKYTAMSSFRHRPVRHIYTDIVRTIDDMIDEACESHARMKHGSHNHIMGGMVIEDLHELRETCVAIRNRS